MEATVLRLLIILCVCFLSQIEKSFCSDENDDTELEPLECPESCECFEDFAFLHCKNSFKITENRFAGLTKKLKLERNFIGPIFNGTFKNLAALEVLDLSNCDINYIQNGAFVGLTNLRKIHLGGNLIQMLDKFLFKDNMKVEKLDLSRNQLRYLSDEPFKYLPSLKTLNVSYNLLTSARLGMRFQVTTQLTVIDFSGNNIENVTADDFATTQRWESTRKWLNFTNCNLKFIEPEAIQELRHVEYLGLAYNKDLTFGNISSLLDAASEVVLKKLDLSYTNLSNKVPLMNLTTENLGTLSLHDLILSGNGFSAIDNDLLTYVNLRKLVLRNNDLTEIGEGIAKLAHLHYLDLSNNHISTVNEMFEDNMATLVTLKLSNNTLSESSGLNLEKCEKLEELDLSDNLFESFQIPSTLAKVKHVDLSGNKLVSINSGEPLVGLTSLLDLDLSKNQITTLNSFMFRDSNNIKFVSFADNQISSISHQTFLQNCPEVLDLSNNLLESLYHFGWNRITDINLARNKINQIEPQTFFFLDSLSRLDLSSNNISSLDIEVFSHLSNLSHLFLQDNHISHAQPLPEILAYMSKLLYIDLSRNDITSFFRYERSPFFYNYDIKAILLRENKLQVISPYIFSSLEHLEVVDFSRNPFICGCENIPLRDWALSGKVFIKNQENYGYVCRSPNTRGSKTLMNYDTRTFECKRTLFYIVVFSSAGSALMIIAVTTAAVCYFCKRRKKGEMNIEAKEDVPDLIGFEKASPASKEDLAVTPEDFVRSIRENYLKGNPSDTLIDIEFENPNLLIDYRNDTKAPARKIKETNKKSKPDKRKKSKVSKSKTKERKSSDAKKLKYYAQIYEMLHGGPTKNGHPKKKMDHTSMKKILEELEKLYKKNKKHDLKNMLIEMDKEYQKIQEKKKKHSKERSSHHHHHSGQVRRHRSRGNRDLVRMVSLRQSKSMPNVLNYINSLPRHPMYEREMRVPIYHIDHYDQSNPGWARSMVDIPRVHRSSRGQMEGYARLKNRGDSHERFLDQAIPSGYHTVTSGRHAYMVDSRLRDRVKSLEHVPPERRSRERLRAENVRANVETGLPERSQDDCREQVQVEASVYEEPTNVKGVKMERVPMEHHTIASPKGTKLANGEIANGSPVASVPKHKEGHMSQWV